jgi:hypothetical protein
VTPESLRTPLFQDVLKEWAAHLDRAVETGSDASAFANIYMEFLRDPNNHLMRQTCTRFATFMRARSWEGVYAVMEDAIDPELRPIFAMPEASEFYERFRDIVVGEIRDYWQQFLAAKGAQKEKPGPGVLDWMPEN